MQNLCNKYIQWEISTSVVWIIVGALLIISGIILLKVRSTSIKRDGAERCAWDSDYWYLYAAIDACIIIASGTIVILCQIFDIITCINFPELQVYDYLKYKIDNMN